MDRVVDIRAQLHQHHISLNNRTFTIRQTHLPPMDINHRIMIQMPSRIMVIMALRASLLQCKSLLKVRTLPNRMDIQIYNLARTITTPIMAILRHYLVLVREASTSPPPNMAQAMVLPSTGKMVAPH